MTVFNNKTKNPAKPNYHGSGGIFFTWDDFKRMLDTHRKNSGIFEYLTEYRQFLFWSILGCAIAPPVGGRIRPTGADAVPTSIRLFWRFSDRRICRGA